MKSTVKEHSNTLQNCMMVPCSKNSLGSNTESLCFWSIDEFWGWKKHWNYRKVEPDSRISGKWTISFPSLPLSQAFLPVAVLCIAGYTFAVRPSPYDSPMRSECLFSFLRLFCHLWKNLAFFLLTLYLFYGCTSQTSNLSFLWLVSTASFIFKNFHDSRQRF